MLHWFEVNEETGIIDLGKPVVYRRENVEFGDKRECKFTAAAELLRHKRYANDIGDSLRSKLLDRSDGKKRFLAIR